MLRPLFIAIVVGSLATVGCSDDPPDVFEGVSETVYMSASVIVLDELPEDPEAIAEDAIRERVEQENAGAEVESAQLVPIHIIYGYDLESGYHVAWALRVDTSGMPDLPRDGLPGYPLFHVDGRAIVFFEASTGEHLKTMIIGPPS